jgi:hypothetical protein
VSTATHCLEWLWSTLTRASRCGPRASASSGLTAGGKCALSTWKLSSVDCCIHSVICLCQKSLWHAFRATTNLTDPETCPDCRSVHSYAIDCMPSRQARGQGGFRQTQRQTSCLHAPLLTFQPAVLASYYNTPIRKSYIFSGKGPT